jgi:Carboxypeptidase regulatory-like domain
VNFAEFMFLFLTLWSWPKSPQPQAPPTGTLKGVVHGPAGELTAGVKVRVENWYFDLGAPHVLTEIVLYTDHKGEFSARVPAGVYDVLVSRPEWEPVAKKVKVVAGKETSFNPHLKWSKLTEFIE